MSAVEPRPAATLILVREGENGIESLMIRRPSRGAFGGMWVFPGGALETVDDSLLSRRAVISPDDCDDFPWRAAALRETAEEVGLAIADPPVCLPPAVRGSALYESVLAAGSRLDGDSLRSISRWITPPRLPVRFDTRFYLGLVSGDPALTPDPHEVVDISWIRPADALAREVEGRWPMVTPTVHHLEWLAGHATPEAAWTAAEHVTDERLVSPFQPDGSLAGPAARGAGERA